MAIPTKEAVKLLRAAYEARGYIRVKMDRRQGGKRTGWEIRLRARTPREARFWAQALIAIQLRPGKPYGRGATTVLPLYGRKQLELFLRRVRPRTKDTIPRLPDNTDLRLRDRS